MKQFVFIMAILLVSILVGCNRSETTETDEALTFIQNYESLAGTPDYAMDSYSTGPGPSVINLRYWQTANPGIRWTRTFDTLGMPLNYFRLAYNDNGTYLTGTALVNKMKQPIWEGHKFEWWLPVKDNTPQYISKYDTVTVFPNAPDSTGWYWVIGWHTYPNPAYNPNWYAEYLYKKEVFEIKLREWFVFEEKMGFPVIPGTADYKWQYVYNYGQPGQFYVDIQPIPGKWNGNKWMLTTKDKYEKFAYWGTVMAYKPYWLGTANLPIP